MLLSNGIFYVTQKTFFSFLVVHRNVKFKPAIVPFRTFVFNKFLSQKKIINKEDDSKLKPLSGYDDPRFTDNLKKAIFQPKVIATGLVKFLGNFKKLYDEQVELFNTSLNPRIDSRENRVDMLYTFENEKDLNKFQVHTDSSFMLGYSSASLKLTSAGTGVFSGNICTELPKDGNTVIAGYANLLTKKQRKSFLRTKTFDLSEYTHLVFKIRGDGRSYLVQLHVPSFYEEIRYTSYCLPLYTRGGPYWQIAKMPLSHFFLSIKGKVSKVQSTRCLIGEIHKFGITVSGTDGPFKLEIDYIGLEFDPTHKTTSPYELYRKNY